MATLGGDHESLGEIESCVHLFGQPQQHRRLNAVDLVDCQRHAAALGDVAKLLKDTLHTFGHATVRFDQKHDHIRIGSPAPSGSHHGTVKPAARLEQAGRVDEDKLRVALHRHATDAGAGGLDFMRYDRDFGPNHAVQQRGFARVGLSDQGDESGTGGHEFFSNCRSNVLAAACSAARFEGAVAAASAPLSNRAVMVKTGAWSGPLRSVWT